MGSLVNMLSTVVSLRRGVRASGSSRTRARTQPPLPQQLLQRESFMHPATAPSILCGDHVRRNFSTLLSAGRESHAIFLLPPRHAAIDESRIPPGRAEGEARLHPGRQVVPSVVLDAHARGKENPSIVCLSTNARKLLSSSGVRLVVSVLSLSPLPGRRTASDDESVALRLW